MFFLPKFMRKSVKGSPSFLANSWTTGHLTWAGWVHHSWRFGHAEALREVGPEMPERGSKTSTVPVVWATFGIFSARSKWFRVGRDWWPWTAFDIFVKVSLDYRNRWYLWTRNSQSILPLTQCRTNDEVRVTSWITVTCKLSWRSCRNVLTCMSSMSA